MAVYKEVRTGIDAEEPVATTPRDANIVARIIYFVGGLLILLLALRFLFVLLGANPGNGIANFIYTVSHPFVTPFFGLFNYDQAFNGHRFEWATVVAIVIYAIIMELLVRLVSIGDRRSALRR